MDFVISKKIVRPTDSLMFCNAFIGGGPLFHYEKSKDTCLSHRQNPFLGSFEFVYYK